ncbi:MAG: hypothetical protein ACXVPN_11905 [Bacteroidia bacterium]
MKTVLKTIIVTPLLLYAIIRPQAITAQTTDKVPANTTTTYRNAVGLRIGETSGVTFKHFFTNSSAFEGIVGAWPYSLGITALYENYIPSGAKGLNFYVGGGGHINTGYGRSGYYVYNGDSRYYVYRAGYPGLGIGIDGIIGAEYKVPKVPFAVSFDLKPFVEFNNAPNVFFALDPGLGLKFTF